MLAERGYPRLHQRQTNNDCYGDNSSKGEFDAYINHNPSDAVNGAVEFWCSVCCELNDLSMDEMKLVSFSSEKVLEVVEVLQRVQV